MADKESKISNSVNIRNKRAGFEFEFLEKFTAGMVLQGTEIKSIRQGKVSFQDSYCIFFHDELFVRDLHISAYDKGTHYNHEPKRDRKLLLSKKELKRLSSKSEEKGLSIIPVKIFLSSRGYAKIEIALARGKKIHDKRESIKDRDLKRDLERNFYR
ncbi:MAG TPA: SsrA-binding protein SmpB [Cyclobacteriaceae bacterium]|nr:SsrA-binding protein SmpB [Cyclobacteriaceae bacterium]